MFRLMVTLCSAALLALACGSGDAPSEAGSEAGTPPVSAKGSAEAPGGPAGSAAPEAAAAAPAEELDPQVEGCLSLVRQARFQEAIAPCTAALRAHPDNQEVKDALARSQAEVAKLADAEGAARAAASGAASDAQSQAEAAASDAQSQAEAAASDAQSQAEGAAQGVTDKLRY